MNDTSIFEWAVVGAGPAGIATVGKLIDVGIDPKKIAWIDPEFKVGDFGQRWSNVSSNTKAKLFVKFLQACKAFRFDECEQSFELQTVDPEKTCFLRLMVSPLQWVTDHLIDAVYAARCKVQSLHLENRCWTLTLKQETIRAKHVVLAVGSEPKVLHMTGPKTITLQDALDTERLSSQVTADDTVAVFGSSHSAILVIKDLLDCGVKKVVNFYLDPLRYAVDLGDWILFDDTGLKGLTAVWARENIDGKWPAGLQRFISSEEHLTQHLPECNKAVYAVGFERRHLPIVTGLEPLRHNEQSGIIAPGLFGFGIAFPECKANPFGTKEHRVGLWKFMDYLNRVMPVWLKYGT